MSAGLSSFSRLARWCARQGGWPSRQPTLCYLMGHFLSSRLSKQIRGGQAPAAKDIDILTRLFERVLGSSDAGLRRASWLTMRCLANEMIAPGNPDRFSAPFSRLIDQWPSGELGPDAQIPELASARQRQLRQNAYGQEAPSGGSWVFGPVSLLCCALAQGHPRCAQALREKGCPWALTDELGRFECQTLGVILARAGGFSPGIPASALLSLQNGARVALMAALEQGALPGSSLVPPEGAFTAFFGAPPVAEGRLSLSELISAMGADALWADCQTQRAAQLERDALAAEVPARAQASRSGSRL